MNASQTEAVVGNLSENTKYTVQLRAATAVGYGPAILANITTLVEGRSMEISRVIECIQLLFCRSFRSTVTVCDDS